ncbi:hypothetical protein [Azospirillum sp. sgz302134]
MFGTTSTRFEVQVRREGRWVIEGSFQEEGAAMSSARVQMTTGGAEEVKITKFRSLAGVVLERIIFQKSVPVVKEKPLLLGGTAEGAPFCQAPDDLYGFEARVVMGRLLRHFLDKFQISPTELLHSWSYIRKLEDQGTLLGAAIHAVARHHADVHGTPVPARVKELRALADVVAARARDFHAERKRLPDFDPRDLPASSRAIDAAVGEDGHDAVFLGQLVLHLANRNSLMGKLDSLLDLLHEDSEPRHFLLIDGVMADVLGSVDVVKDLLGDQPNLAMGLCVMADHLLGRDPTPDAQPVHPMFTRIGDLIVHGRAPGCQAVLVERIRRSLDGNQPLDRRDRKAEALLVDQLSTRLKDGQGRVIGGLESEKALARRLVRHRQTILREQGMHDIADRLSGR